MYLNSVDLRNRGLFGLGMLGVGGKVEYGVIIDRMRVWRGEGGLIDWRSKLAVPFSCDHVFLTIPDAAEYVEEILTRRHATMSKIITEECGDAH